MMFTILDGRTELWQWDLNRKIVVEDATITEVHFCNGKSDCSLVCAVRTENGNRIADIPNILLQDHPQCKLRGFFELRVFAYCGDDYTKAEEKIKVNARSKPDDYVYTETEIKKGVDGKPAYEYAREGGYTGTEEEFAAKLADTSYFTPQMFGAKGDGVTDDTEAFKKCFEHTNIYIPAGTYILTETIDVLTKTNVMGNTRESAIINSTADVVFNAQGFVDVSNLRIIGNKTNTGIVFPQHNLRLVNVDFRSLNIGVKSNGETTVKFNSLERCLFYAVNYPLDFDSATAQFNTTMILNCTFREYVCALTAPHIYSVKFDNCAFLGEVTDNYILDVQSNVNTVFQSCYIETWGELVTERWLSGDITVKNTWIYTHHPFFHARETAYYRTAKFVESTIINSDSDEETFPMLIDGTNLVVDLVECNTSLGAKNADKLAINTIGIAEQYGIATNCRINNGYLTIDTLPIYGGEVE